MAEQKTKIAGKTQATTRTLGSAAGKAKATKAALTPISKKTAAKKALVKKALVVEPRKTKAAAVKKAAAPAGKKPVAKKNSETSKIKAAVSKPEPIAKNKTVKLTPEERYRMVETAAYFIAERHGFQGRSDEHWAAAEREVAARLGK